ncbi:PadR family transcriptional regulator [Mycolicibacter kumamotonensis]|uniref:PadR family transcriptional regulator n=2 Tax=Mycobacteriaceae TaxID=1762 RepID=A0A1X1W6F1_MYCIR|nr:MULTISPECIES: PadR family transcriptional regulator [Mycobacteriaceae]ORA81348.1 PadR family transcriptional regulator [Mycolicibacter kumamotonensis]ORV82176.1 PadR family transcriptional regulator [Mycolicibacterium iranicum]
MSLRIAVLGLLSQQSGSGYDLLKRFEESLANVWPATQSQLYGELLKLADAGMIEASAVGARGRKEYRILPAGRAELERWMTDPLGDPPFRSAQLLRLFLLSEVSPDQARAYVGAIAELADAEIDRLGKLKDSIEWSEGDSHFYGRAVLEYGLRMKSMEADYARWLAEAIADRHRRSRRSGGTRRKTS